MDNPQKTDVVYAQLLASFLDGEGNVQLLPWKNRGRIGYQASIRFDNEDHRILHIIRGALAHFGVAFHAYQSSPTRNSPCITLKIQRLTMLKRLLDVVLETAAFLGKRQECELLREYVISRLGPDGRPLQGCKENPYSERACQIAEEIKATRASQRAYASSFNIRGRKAEDVLWTSMKVEEQNRNASAVQETVQ